METEQELLDKIGSLTQMEMARLHRFAPSGHPFFERNLVGARFQARFTELGGMTPAISKALGWSQ